MKAVLGAVLGLIAVGHNWHGENIIGTQKKVLGYFGFNVVDELCWNWEFISADDESNESYKKATQEFERIFFD